MRILTEAVLKQIDSIYGTSMSGSISDVQHTIEESQCIQVITKQLDSGVFTEEFPELLNTCISTYDKYPAVFNTGTYCMSHAHKFVADYNRFVMYGEQVAVASAIMSYWVVDTKSSISVPDNAMRNLLQLMTCNLDAAVNLATILADEYNSYSPILAVAGYACDNSKKLPAKWILV